jgi:hypothetical protein
VEGVDIAISQCIAGTIVRSAALPFHTGRISYMFKLNAVLAISALTLAISVTSQPAFARNNGGAVAAGVVGGLAVGAIVGSQASRNYYGGPAYYESDYQPVYQNCRTERQRFEDEYGRLRVQRVRVCD